MACPKGFGPIVFTVLLGIVSLDLFRLSLKAVRPQESTMRTFTITNTNGTVLGQNQDRVVMANREGCTPARPHLMSHDWRDSHASLKRTAATALKRWVAETVTGAARIVGIYYPLISGPQLCRLPVQSPRLHASVGA
jgi:hypothetical protein